MRGVGEDEGFVPYLKGLMEMGHAMTEDSGDEEEYKGRLSGAFDRPNPCFGIFIIATSEYKGRWMFLLRPGQDMFDMEENRNGKLQLGILYLLGGCLT